MERLNRNKQNWIQTYSCSAFDFECMSKNSWDQREVAVILSRIPRFAGHTKWRYSVAQHSVLVSRQFSQPKHILIALIHDTAEVFIGDNSSPLKQYLSGHTDALERLERRIWEWIAGIHCVMPEFVDEIKNEDLRALATESRDLMLPPPKPGSRLPDPWALRIEPWSEEYACDEWLRSYEEVQFI